MKKLITLLMLTACLSISAKEGGVTPIPANRIVEVKTEITTNSKGKEVKTYVVIYQDAQGNRRMANMTAADHKKMEQARKYNVFIEYSLVEGKSRNKIIVK